MSRPRSDGDGLSAVLDIGKTNCALVLFDRRGQKVLMQQSASGVSEAHGLGYPALDTAGTETWLKTTLGNLGTHANSLRRIIVTTHGAAIAALRAGKLHFPVPDYEWEGFDASRASVAEVQNFSETQSPLLPRGLNLGAQLEWMEQHHPELMATTEAFLPYPQYWAWWLSGVASSEVSSLGCHTLLWNPREQTFSDWAQKRGWAQRFARMRRAWEVLGTLRPELSRELGLPLAVEVHVGAHDSNACLARYLRSWPRMTLVSTGTWVVVMTPGSHARRLNPDLDQLANVSVRGECVPTARFMGGREVGILCAGANPADASIEDIQPLLERGLLIDPSFESQGGPFSGRQGAIRLDGRTLTLDEWAQTVAPAQRATGAAIYAAFVSARMIDSLNGFGPIVVDGPFAHNAVFMQVLAGLLPRQEVYACDDSIDGTIQGAWSLTHWTEPTLSSPTVRQVQMPGAISQELQAIWERWPSKV